MQSFLFCYTTLKTILRFGNKMFHKVIGNPMGTDYAPVIPDLFLYCYQDPQLF